MGIATHIGLTPNKPKNGHFDMQIKTIHRYISLVFAALWLLQAITGCLIVFRWDIDDAGVAGSRAAFQAEHLGARLDSLITQPDTHVSSVWSANNSASRFDIFYSHADTDRTLRVDGQGAPLRDRRNDTLSDGNIFDRLSDLHMALMLGDTGRAFLGISGILLLTNIGLGLKLAWPRAGQWIKALGRPKGKAAVPLLYGWHRMLGLWMAVPAFITISAGVLLAFDGSLEGLFKAEIPAPAAAASTSEDWIKPSAALSAAIAPYPGATLSGLSMPDADTPWYKIRLRAKGEMPRIWGLTTLYVNAHDGHILSNYDARQAHGPARLMLDTIYPLHTGQIGGVTGRIVQLLIGLWLIAMIGMGISLWWTRKRLMKKKAAA
jgi:uncharacterized iron-regulated membrane protein